MIRETPKPISYAADLHTRNLAFTQPNADNLAEDKFLEMLGTPDIGLIQRADERSLDLEPGMPKYLVMPASNQLRSWNSSQSIKIIDFGESFLTTESPRTLHTPFPVRAPEVIFQDRIDYRVDLWGMGCMVSDMAQVSPKAWQLVDGFDSCLSSLLASRHLIHF